MAKFIQMSTLLCNHFVESSNKLSMFQAAAAANAHAYKKKQCFALLSIAVIIALAVTFNCLQQTYVRRELVDVSQKNRFSTGSAATCRRMPTVNDHADRELCRQLLQAGNYTTKSSSAQEVHWFPATDDSYVRCATNCNHFRRQFGYSMSFEDVTEEERRFPLAFRLEKY
jgi:hypothetical protein